MRLGPLWLGAAVDLWIPAFVLSAGSLLAADGLVGARFLTQSGYKLLASMSSLHFIPPLLNASGPVRQSAGI